MRFPRDMRAFYSDHFVLPLPLGHRFPMAKYRLLRERLEAELPELTLSAAEPASNGELALVHTPSYIQSVVQGTLTPAQQKEIGFPWSPAMVERSRRSTGATIMAARAALLGGEGVCANLAGGTHHAYADQGSGFCVFNDAAVATRLMQAEWGRTHQHPLKVAIIDLDVHQGNGTARIFERDAQVFTLSMHGARNFPFAKESSDLDVELPDGCGDMAYMDALEQALAELEDRFNPGLVIYLAGADPHEGDRLGRLSLSFDGLEARDRRVFDWAWSKRIPLAFCMAGGYGHQMTDTVQVQVNTYRVAHSYWRRWQNLTLSA
jgi:acetoin utilization deacetylase AcuC-like enzyme